MRRRVLFGAAACGSAALCLHSDVQEASALHGIRASASRMLVPEAQSESAPCLSRIDYLDKVPSRKEQLRKLASGSEHNPFDVLIIGGGATGTGCALDAVTR